MESDTVYKGRALAKEWKGKRIATSFVNILDDPSLKSCHGTFFFDDEGQIAKPTYLVKNGIVNDYITEMLTAKKMKVPMSANGRCESFDHKNYARMSVTFFAKGKSNHKENE
jgi:TldD protein